MRVIILDFWFLKNLTLVADHILCQADLYFKLWSLPGMRISHIPRHPINYNHGNLHKYRLTEVSTR